MFEGPGRKYLLVGFHRLNYNVSSLSARGLEPGEWGVLRMRGAWSQVEVAWSSYNENQLDQWSTMALPFSGSSSQKNDARKENDWLPWDVLLV